MVVNMTLEVTLTLPDGSASMDMTGGRGWVLPDGQVIKIWAVPELDDESDLSWQEAGALGVSVEDMVTSVEISDEGF
jgi:hypothetical protein